MNEDDTSAEEPGSTPVHRLLSRFGPVPEADPNRVAPGPRPTGDRVNRPKPGPRPGAKAAPERTATLEADPRDEADRSIEPEPLFAEPHDEVFGDPSLRSPEYGERSVFDDPEPEPDEPLEVIDRRDWVRMPRRTGPTFRFILLALVIGLGATLVYSRVTTWFDDQLDPPGAPGSAVEFTIASGATSNDVTQALFRDDVIANPTLFRYWLGDNFDGDFQAGEYICLQENMSFDEALACLDGEGPLPPQFFSITIPEGLRLEEILERLNRENPAYQPSSLEDDLLSPLVSIDLEGVPERPNPESPDPTGSGKEGMLFPATYQIDERNEADSLDILRRMAETMEQKFEQAVTDEGRAEVISELELTDYQVLIIASLIEEEAITDGDRPKIARVIYNRLLQGESLGIDATTCYAAQKLCSDLTQEDLDSPSPWNTRLVTNRRLPPTPIAAPGERSVRAALNPDPGEWFFYVRTEEDGSHTFVETSEEFAAAKAICEERGYC